MILDDRIFVNVDLNAKVDDKEEYILEVTKEKIQAEEQYLKQKQIITG